jgi:hypothetical protein
MNWHLVLRLSAALPALLATVALGANKSVMNGVINDQAGVYSDMGGPRPVAAAEVAINDSGLEQKAWTSAQRASSLSVTLRC